MELRRNGQGWDEEFDQLTRSMQERMDGFFREQQPQHPRFQQQPPSPTPSSGRGRIEQQADGSLLYKIIFDVRGYEPSDLKTSLIGDRTVRICGAAKRLEALSGKQTSASFDEQFSLPDNVDPARLRSVVANGQLVISAPVLPPQYHHQQQPLHSQVHSSLYSQSSPRLSPRSASPSSFGQPQQQQSSGVRTVSAYQLEVDVGTEFEPQDLTVATARGGRKLTVHGRREVKAAGKTSMREFRDEFDLPAGVDPALVTARLRSDGRIVVDMPLLKETAGFTYWPVAVDHR